MYTSPRITLAVVRAVFYSKSSESCRLVWGLGSTVVYPYNNRSLPELELGSSIFGKSNRNIWRASDEFALTHRTFHDENYETGIWNGKDLFLSVCDRSLDRTFIKSANIF